MNFWCKNENLRIINVFVNISSENLIDFNTYIMASVCTIHCRHNGNKRQQTTCLIHTHIISFPFRVMQKSETAFYQLPTSRKY